MRKIVEQQQGSSNSFSYFNPSFTPHSSVRGERFWFVWEFSLARSNPFVWGEKYQEWSWNRFLIHRFYAEGMDESEIISFFLFDELLGGDDEWN